MSRSKDGDRASRRPGKKNSDSKRRPDSGGASKRRTGASGGRSERGPGRKSAHDDSRKGDRRDSRNERSDSRRSSSKGPDDRKPRRSDSSSRPPLRRNQPKRSGDQRRGPGRGERRGTTDGPSRGARLGVPDLAQALVTELERRLRRHPSGDLVGMRRETVPLVLELPVSTGAERLRAAGESLEGALRGAVDRLVAGRSAESTGQAYCLRCTSFDCGHGAAEPRQVFIGFAANGTPRFEEYSQALLARGDEGMEELFGPAGRVVTRLWTEDELFADVLPTFVPGADAEADAAEQSVRVLAQVTAGWFWVPELEDPSAPRNFAVSFQVLAIEPLQEASRKASRRLVLSVVARSPLGGPLEDLQDEMGELPWAEAARWLRGALSDAEAQDRRAASSGRQGSAGNEPWESRVLRIVAGFERRLTRRERAGRRRTKHAEDRRKQKRPTGHALSDLDRADDEQVLQDTHRSTFVVLGERGRTHIFNPQGRLVTSIQYTPEAIERRRSSGRWQSADREHVQALRAAVAEVSG